MDADELRRHLEFYQDLGIRIVSGRGRYRRRNAPPERPAPDSNAEPIQEVSPMPTPVAQLPGMAPAGDTLFKILRGHRRLHALPPARRAATRSSSASETSRRSWYSWAKGPGADEDEQGIPFVGRAGQLLTQMIENTAKKEGIPLLRKDVYICNVVKCRPPENRTPEPEEMEICGEFLFRQLHGDPAESHLRAGRHRGARRCWALRKASPGCAGTGTSGTTSH